MQKNYTLFIDESGDFETHQGDWVVAGVLCPGNLSQARSALLNACTPLIAELDMPQRAFHAWRLREAQPHGKGAEEPLRIIRSLLGRVLTRDEGTHFLAAVNVAKRRIGNHGERTRRQMISDVVALATTTLPPGATISQLDVVDSRRRNAAKEVVTTEDELKEHLYLSLADAIEVSLASRGILDAVVGNNIRVTIEEGNECWGLIAADFVANLVFHARDPLDSELVEELEQTNSLKIFQSFGGIYERQARIAERDGDYIGALCQWSVIKPQPEKIAEERRTAVQRLCRRIVADGGSRGPRNAFETVIDTVHRRRENGLSLSRQHEALLNLEASLSAAITGQETRFQSLLFRLRNYRLLTLNHLGDVTLAEAVRALQEKAAKQLGFDPECYHDVLQYTNLSIEVFVNRMEFGQALAASVEYLKMVQHYKAFWNLLTDEPQEDAGRSAFKSSRLYISATSAHIRLLVLAADKNADLQLAQALDMAEELRPHMTLERDISRLDNYCIMALLRSRRYEEALDMAHAVLSALDDKGNQANDFNRFWAARAAADWMLARRGAYSDKAEKIFERLRAIEWSGEMRSPQDLILRELGLLSWLHGDRKEAKRQYERSKAAQEKEFQSPSPINCWLEALLVVHLDQMADDPPNARRSVIGHITQHSPDGVFSSEFLGALRDVDASLYQGSMLLALRSLSPY